VSATRFTRIPPSWRNFLSPEGSHGQGKIFLEKFLLEVGERQDLDWLAKPPEADDWTVNTEEWFNDGRLDIVVRSGVTPLLLVIENKIYAADAEDQLQRYERWMGRQPGHANQKILIYLTLDGKPCAGTQPANYCRLSYRENIVQWLTRSQERVRAGAVAVRDVCEQYLKTIAMLCGGTDMNTSEDTSQVDAFLREPDNYRFAGEVHERLEKLIDELIKEFWRRLRAKVREDPRARGWDVSIRWESRTVKDWGLDAIPAGSDGKYVMISAVEDASGFAYGIVRIGARKTRCHGRRWTDYLSVCPENSYPWWAAYRVVLKTRLRDHNFWQRTPQEQLRLADEIASAVCELIESAGDFVKSKEIEAARQAATV
jgi:hypothetical protein